MKSFKSPWFLISILLIHSCSYIEQVPNDLKVSLEGDLAIENSLMVISDKYGFDNLRSDGENMLGTTFGNIVLDSYVRLVDEGTGRETYTFNLLDNEKGASYLIITATSVNNSFSFLISPYQNGQMSVFNLEEEWIGAGTIESATSSGRNEGCGTITIYEEGTMTYNPDGDLIKKTIEVLIIDIDDQGCGPGVTDTSTGNEETTTSGGGGSTTSDVGLPTDCEYGFDESGTCACGPDMFKNRIGDCMCAYGVNAEGDCMSEEEAWIKSICTSATFDSNSCISSVWNQIKQSGGMAAVISQIENSNWIELCLDTNVLNPIANGETMVSGSSITINMNIAKLNRSQLSIAKTFFHELIHAELYRKVKSVGGTVSPDNFPGIYDYYRRYVKNWQHEQMAAHYIGMLSQALSAFDNNSQQMSFYEDISWMGLWKISDYNTSDPNDTIESQAWLSLSQSERNRISSAILNYQANENKLCQ